MPCTGPSPTRASNVWVCFPWQSWWTLNSPNRRGTDPYARWCGRGGIARCPPIPIVEKVVVDDQSLTIKLRCGPLLGGGVPASASEDGRDNAVELAAAVAFQRRGAETKLVLPGLA